MKHIAILNPEIFVKADIFPNEESVVQEALRLLLRERADLRIKLALYCYQHEGLSLAKAAALAGVSWAQMKQIMLEQGIQPNLGPETLLEAEQEVESLRKFLARQI